MFCTIATWESPQSSKWNEELQRVASQPAGTSSLPYLEKAGLAQQPPLLSEIPSAAWQPALGSQHRRMERQGQQHGGSQAVLQKETLQPKTFRAWRACRGCSPDCPLVGGGNFISLGLSFLIWASGIMTCCTALPCCNRLVESWECYYQCLGPKAHS